MIYLDYSASTPTDEKILEAFVRDSRELIGNANSLHASGRKCKEAIDKAGRDILNALRLSPEEYEIVYTSGSSEANNLAVKGFASDRNIRIITTSFEHDSVTAPIALLQKKGTEVEVLDVDRNGRIDLNHLENLLDDRTTHVATQVATLVAITGLNSELGIKMPIGEIKRIIRKYPNTVLHVDATQVLGKIDLDYSGIGMFCISAHKIYGIKGIGALIKKKSIILQPQLSGGRSSSKYRSGTPPHPLIMSLRNAVLAAQLNLKRNREIVKERNRYLREKLSSLKEIIFNTPDENNHNTVDHILNISIIGFQSADTVAYLSNRLICVSSQTACGSEKTISRAVLQLTGDKKRAESCIRISLSHLTTEKETDELVYCLKEMIGGRS